MRSLSMIAPSRGIYNPFMLCLHSLGSFQSSSAIRRYPRAIFSKAIRFSRLASLLAFSKNSFTFTWGSPDTRLLWLGYHRRLALSFGPARDQDAASSNISWLHHAEHHAHPYLDCCFWVGDVSRYACHKVSPTGPTAEKARAQETPGFHETSPL